jgi:hypothetical protein
VRWPIRLTVGVTAAGTSGGGHLDVAPGVLVCELGPMARRFAGIDRVVHGSNSVHVFRARIVPFWFNVACVVDDGRSAVLASKSAFELNALVKTLRNAGFDVEVHKTWTDLGRSLGAPRRHP